jgi:serine/threonine protein kinase
MDLLGKMLEKDPRKRISAENAVNHPYLFPHMDE